jgi:hypothetical protein
MPEPVYHLTTGEIIAYAIPLDEVAASEAQDEAEKNSQPGDDLS